MDQLPGTVGTAVGVFAGTNIDDVIVLTVLFLTYRAAGRPRPWQIVVGQYAGVGVLVGISAVVAAGLTVVPDRWIGLLGVVPVALGLWGLVTAVRARRRGDEKPPPVVASGLASVAAVTVANGADNISVYAPLFRTIGLAASVVTVCVFAVLIAVWCAASAWLGSHRRVIGTVERFGHWLVPAVFIAIGWLILIGSGVLGEL